MRTGLCPQSAQWPWLEHLFGDGAYDRTKLLDEAALHDLIVEIIRQSDDVSGFTFGWIKRWRRLVLDNEKRPDVSEPMIHLYAHSLTDANPRRRGQIVCPM